MKIFITILFLSWLQIGFAEPVFPIDKFFSKLNEMSDQSYGPKLKSDKTAKKLGISFEKFSKGFDLVGLKFKYPENDNGIRHVFGDTLGRYKAEAIIDATGNEDNLQAVFLGVSFTDEAKKIGTVLCINIFLKNVFPEWKEGSEWIFNTMTDLMDSEKDQKTIVKNGKKLEITIIPALGWFTINVKPI